MGKNPNRGKETPARKTPSRAPAAKKAAASPKKSPVAPKAGSLGKLPKNWTKASNEAVKKYVLPVHRKTKGIMAQIVNPDPAHNVIGMGLSHKRRKGKWGRTACLTFYVLRKIKDRAGIPEKYRLPDEIQKIPTDVVELGRLEMISDPTFPGEGLLVRNANNPASLEAGTIGGILKDNNGTLYLLSNNHVISQMGGNPLGTDVRREDPSGVIARVAVAVPLQASPHLNEVDAAIARVLDPTDVLPALESPLASAAFLAPAVDRTVKKTGARTGTTSGIIRVTNGTFSMDGPMKPNGTKDVYKFQNVILIEPTNTNNFCDFGDSGSLLVDSVTRRPVGLVMGRSIVDGKSWGVACVLSTAVNRLSQAVGKTLSFQV